MSKNVIIERSSKERIESVTIGDLKFSLHDEFEYADGGIITEILDSDGFKESAAIITQSLEDLPQIISEN